MKRRPSRQRPKPAAWQLVERCAGICAKRDEAANAAFAEAAQQNVREPSAALAIARAKRGDTMGEMKAQSRLRRERQKMFIPLFRARGRERDLAWRGTSRTDERAHPS